MNSMNHDKHSTQIKDGERAEIRFKSIAESHGITVKESTYEENKKFHIDYHLNHNGHKTTVDVKAIKSINRKLIPNEFLPFEQTWNWIEYKNNYGRPGWLFGKMDYIAFETLEGFAMAKPKDVYEYCERTVTKEPLVYESLEGRYRFYQRREYGNKDECCYIEIWKIPNVILFTEK